MPWRYLIEGPWIVFIAYWAVGALKTRRTERTETFASRYGILFLEIVGFALLFRTELSRALMLWPITGVVLTCTGPYARFRHPIYSPGLDLGGDRLGAGNRPMALRGGSLPDYSGLLD